VEEALRQRQRETEALLAAARAIPMHYLYQDAARGIFDAAKGLLGADSGYVALLSDTGEENEVLFLDAGGRDCTVDPSLPMPIRGLRSVAYFEKRVVWDNAFPTSEHMRFMPAGHVALDNVMFAPIIVDDKVVGAIGLANKPGGFTEKDAELAASFGDIAAVGLRFARDREALEQSEQRFRQFFENAPEYCFIVSPEGAIVDVNRAALDQLGYQPDELIGARLQNVYAPESQPTLEQLLAESQSVNNEALTMITSGQQPRHVLLSTTHVWDAENNLVHSIWVQRDVTELKKAEIELQRHRDHLEELVATRTAELEKSYEVLRERKAELEMFNTVMVDREMKIIELKEEVNQLSEKLGAGCATNRFGDSPRATESADVGPDETSSARQHAR
jgi:PAS domain S-box-containing protein